MEFNYGDRIKWKHRRHADEPEIRGTVINDQDASSYPILGNFYLCMPCPVAVLWDVPGEVWWESGFDLELVEK